MITDYGAARQLVADALFLRMYGERPPGAPKDKPDAETWREWDTRAEAWLQSLSPIADLSQPVIQRRSLPDRLRHLADELEIAGDAQRFAIALMLRMTADEVSPNECPAR